MIELLECIERIENGSDNSVTLNFLRTFKELVTKQESIIQDQRFMFNSLMVLVFVLLVIIVATHLFNGRK